MASQWAQDGVLQQVADLQQRWMMLGVVEMGIVLLQSLLHVTLSMPKSPC